MTNEHIHCFCVDLVVNSKPHKSCCMCSERKQVFLSLPTPFVKVHIEPLTNGTSITANLKDPQISVQYAPEWADEHHENHVENRRFASNQNWDDEFIP